MGRWRERGISEELRRSVAARDEFIAISSHELRTPLTALNLQIETLLRLIDKGDVQPSNDRLRSKLAVVLRQAHRLTQLVETLLEVSRLSQGALELDTEQVDLIELVKAVVARFEDEVRAQGGSIRVVAAGVRGWWDKVRIDRLLSSLLRTHSSMRRELSSK